MNELALFAGAGGGILGGKLLGWKTICAVEILEYNRAILLQRQRDKILPLFPIWDDVCTFNGTQWRGVVDIVTGGFPCQDISSAGRGAGIEGSKSKLWAEMLRIICETMPKYVFVENSPVLTSRGLGRVLGDLAKIGYDAEWGVLGASDLGANHHRKRIWILAYTNSVRQTRDNVKKSIDYTLEKWETNLVKRNDRDFFIGEYGKLQHRWEQEKEIESKLVGRLDEFPHRLDRFTAIGNAQVPNVAASAFLMLHKRIDDNNSNFT